MKRKMLLKKLLIVFLIVSMLMNTSTTVLAATVDAISDAIETEENELEEIVEENEDSSEEGEEIDSESEEEIQAEEIESEIEAEEIESEPEDTVETDVMEVVTEEVVSENDEENIEKEKVANEIHTLSAKYTSNNGSIYDVILTYGNDANIPEGAKLSVSEILEGTEKYNDAREAIVNDKEEKGEDSENFEMIALDISILDANGNEVEPEAPVSVEMKIESLPGVEDLTEIADSLEIQHHVEAEGEAAIEVVAQNAQSNDELNIEENSIETKFDVESFSTFTITWYYNYYKTTIHYGYMNGNTFTEFSQTELAPSPTNYSTDHHAYLLYDFEGYQYTGNTYYRTSESTNPSSSGGTRISPVLNYNNNNWQRRGTSSDSSWNNVANNSHIYVVYEAKTTPTTGGTPTVKENTQPPEAPEIKKNSEVNGDGTNTLSLTVMGNTTPLEVEKLADVIVVFDVSGSMSYNMDGSQKEDVATKDQRLTIAQKAVNDLADNLLSKTNSDGDKLVRMALVSFSTDAQIVNSGRVNGRTVTFEGGDNANIANTDFTSNPTLFKAAVNGLSASGGTNWEKALKIANEMTVDPERATFIIFVTDGDPTFRISRMGVTNANLDINGKNGTDTYYRSNNVFGTGQSASYTTENKNYDAAVAEGTSITSNNKNFYTIGISNDVTKVKSFNTDTSGDGAYLATSSSELETAFNDIQASIEGVLGYTAGITDGITGLTNLTAKTPLVGVSVDNFKYYKKAKGSNNYVDWDPVAAGANEAKYNPGTGAVEWDLGENFILEDGVTYKVEFIVWPSQQAIDYITQLNNGEIEYGNLPEDVRAQITESPAGSGKYILKTNTDDAGATYQLVKKTGNTVETIGDPISVDFDEVDPLNLDTMTLKVKKIFNDTLTSGEDRDDYVVLYAQRRVVNGDGTYGEWEAYNVFQDFEIPTGSTSPNYLFDEDGNPVFNNKIFVNDANNWEASCFISPGLIASGTTYNPGYEFRLTEPDIDYHYDLNSEFIKPMLIDTVKTYVGDNNGDESLTAENIVKGGINVKKILKAQDNSIKADDDTEFIIKGYILDENGNPYTFNTEWDDREDKSQGKVASDEWQAHQNDTGAYHYYDANGNRIGYKLHFASTGEIELHLKAGESVRFVNVPQNSTFSFWEETEGLSEEYKWIDVEGENQTKDASGNYSFEYAEKDEDGNPIPVPQPTVVKEVENGIVINGSVSDTVKGNVQHNATFTNKLDAIDVVFAGTKTLNNKTLEDGQFAFEIVEIIDGEENVIATVTNDATGNINYPTIRYTEVGEHKYVVREASQGGDGITVDSRNYEVTVNITTDATGKFVATTSDNLTSLNFINTYASVGEITFAGTKTLTGRALKEGESFTFKISEGSKFWIGTSDSTGKINFPKIEYTLDDVGTHTYTVEETSTDGNGITVDKNKYTVTVAVADDGDGTLDVSATGSAFELDFVNEYEASDVEVQFSGNKTLTGKDLTNGEFTFELKNASGETIQTKTNAADGTITFDAITYDSEGTYVYTISEVASSNDGVTSDETVYNVTVTVTDNLEGNLVAEITGLNEDGTGADFANSYSAAETEVQFSGNKTLTGKDLTDGEFSFDLEDSSGVIQTVSNDARGTITFEPITYTEAGEYRYKIYEQRSSNEGVTIDDTEYEVIVTVTDDLEGHLVAEITGLNEDGTGADFANEYNTTDVSVQFSGNKTLTGKDLTDGEFTFDLKDASGETIQTKTNTVDGAITFDSITYTEAGEYTYTISEETSSNEGVTIDETVYTVIVTVTDDLEGHLVAEISGIEADGTGADFVNEYEAADVEVQFSGNKTLTGKDLTDGEFTFDLKDTDGNVLQSKTNDAKGTITFDAITYTEVGEYTYTISEEASSNEGVTIDETVYTVIVTVTDDLEGHLVAEISGIEADGTGADFVNEYEAADVEVQFSGNKTLTGKDLTDGEFSFALEDSSGVIQTVSNDARGTITFEPITYTEAGEYRYKIYEQRSSNEGITIDDTEYEVVVTVTDDLEGHLVATISGIEADGTGADFANSYSAAETEVQFSGNKTLNGKDLLDGEFTFDLKDADGNVLQSKTNDAQGTITFDSITYTEVGEYTYTISEQESSNEGVTIDETVYTVIVTVTDDLEGHLVAEISGIEADGTGADFVNEYEAADVEVQFSGNKTLTGKDLTDGEFSFNLKDASGEIIQTKTNTADGTITFDSITYTEVGEYTYTISEQESSNEGVTIDETIYTVIVTVTDDLEGHLVAEISGIEADGTGADFANSYSAAETEVQFSGNKTLNGKDLLDGEFTFDLKDADGNVLQSKTNDAQGTITFDTITYTEAGEYTYTISEEASSNEGVTIDETVYTVIVTVTDDLEGHLVAEVTGIENGVNFVNEYEAADVEVQFTGIKTLEGKRLQNEEFSFALEDASGVIQTVSNDGVGAITFEPITYTEVGEYRYKIYEQKSTNEGVTIDNTEYEVIVTVTDDLEGHLVATISGIESDGTGADFANEYSTTDASVQFSGNKTLTGKDLTDGEFNFALEDSSGVIQTASNNANGEIVFDVITYTEAGEYRYKIYEQSSSNEGITIDDTEYEVIVTVTDDLEGHLVAEISGIEADGTGADFANEYNTTDVSVQFSGNKTLTGKDLLDGEFTFDLKDADGNVLQSKTNDAQGTITFDSITYTEAGEYTYTISEEASSNEGVTIDDTEYEVIVTVTDDLEGHLVATISGIEADGTGADFANEYSAAETEVQFNGNKTLTGKDLTDGEFSFELEDSSGVIQTVSNDARGTIAFEPITYTEVGEYRYKIYEQRSSNEGVTIDNTEYEVVVTVTDDLEGHLVAEVTGIEDGANFVNEYEAADVEVQFNGNKTLTGKDLTDGEFTFDLKDASGETIQTKTNTADGTITFDSITYTEVGEYTYTINEQESSNEGVTIDDTVYTVIVTVTDDLEGHLVAEISGIEADGTGADFVNEYEAADVEVQFSGNKTLTGKDLTDGEFSFDLKDASGEIIQTKTNTADGTITFDSITYTEVGEYTYTINEQESSNEGVTIDETVYSVTVTVTDDLEGHLVATISGIEADGTGADFANSYSAAETEVQFSGNKTLTGKDLTDGEFSFDLEDSSGVIQTVSNDARGTITFEPITYTEVGEYRYKIYEQKSSNEGITIDDTEYEVIVTVTDDLEGHLVAEISGIEADGTGVDFANEYNTTDVSVQFSGNKTLTGKDLTDGEFSFDLKDADGNVLQSKTNDARGTITFDSITYTEAGEYTYTISEQESSNEGVTIDETVYTVIVTVTDDLEGHLVAEVTGIEDGANFANEYEAADVEVQFSGNKTLTGKDLTDGEFSFDLKDASGEIIQTKTNTADGTITFDSITYTEAGEYTYTISEEASSNEGVTIDETVYTVIVTVTDDLEGHLVATISGIESDGTGADFANSYSAAETEVQFSGNKTLTGKDLTDGEFTFDLKDADGNVLQSRTNDTKGTIAFDTITYTEVGEYTYTISEQESSNEGVTIDETVYTVIVTVTDDLEGHLVAEVTGIEDGVNFVNEYEAADVEVQFSGNKTLTGKDLTDGEFSFDLEDSSGVIQTVSNDARGTITFEPITYTEVGEYRYKIYEQRSSNEGVTIDNTEYEVVVTVTDDLEGHLIAEVTGIEDGANFVNEYEAADVEVQFTGNKTLTGKDLTDGEFTFDLKDASGETIQTKTNTADGTITFDAITYDSIGTYEYTISEEASSNEGVTIDETVYTVIVTVTDDLEGHLVAEVTGIEDGINFVNEYEAADVEVQFSGNKTLTGKDLTDGEFTFDLKDADGNVLQSKTNDAQGTITFDSITYTEVGEYTYTISEQESSNEGVTIDETVYSVTVTVTDDLEGHLVATISGIEADGTGADFVNEYEAADVEVQFSGNKTLNGKDLTDGEFSFALENSSGVIQTVSNDARGTVTFEPITYTEVGEYRYKIYEQKSSNEGITIDNTEYEVVVTVTDDLEGHLVAEVTGIEDGANFVNEYEAADVDVQFSGNKTLNGKDLTDGEFAFDLKDADGNVLQSKTNDAKGTITFDAITYTEVGEYTYTINEQESSNEGVTIDETVYTVVVTVTDDLEGHLVAEISGIEADGTGANFVNEYEAADVDVQFSGSKTLDGKDLLDSEFTFDLKDADGNVLQSKTNDAKGTIIFDTITYTEVGEYTYTISEEASSNKGVTIDETVYNVTVTVTDDLEGHLVAEITGLNEDGTGANFTNFYHATGTTEEFKVSKVLEGKELVEGQFEFVLLDTDGNEIGRVSNDAKGAVTFDGISYDETDAGKTYSYTITEINAGEAGYTYDDMAVEITVEVIDNGDGTLSTTVTYSDDKEFNNVYETVEINVQKVWDDNDDQDAIRPDSIEVVLYANGEQLETATLNEENSWSYTWKDLVKHSGGEDKAIIDYTIEEVKVDNYESSMEATSDKDGNIEIVITNTHKVETTEIKVIKIWDDSDNEYEKRPDSVKVQLYANDKAIGDVIVLDESANWAYTWTDLDKNKAGEEIKYTVKEIDVSDSYIDLYSVGEDGTLIVTNQLVGEGGWEDEEPEPPYTGENPNTGANLFDSIELYIALIFGTIVVAAVVTKRTLRK